MQDAEEFCIEEEVDDEQKKSRPIIKNAMDLQRLKLEKLMKNPEKPIIIPEPQREKDFMQSVPTFVRNVMGSSAGAGSGEFHVYRHLRRKEYARQKFIQSKSIREQLDDEYRQKLERNRLDAEAKTAKRRAKRLKKKQKMKHKGKRSRRDCEDNEKNDEDLSESSESDRQSEIEEKVQSAPEKEEVQTRKEINPSNEHKSNDASVAKKVEAECPHVGDGEDGKDLVHPSVKVALLGKRGNSDIETFEDDENSDKNTSRPSENKRDSQLLEEKGEDMNEFDSNT